MRHSFPPSPQFYVTAPQPCPYLAGQSERKLFTSLDGGDADQLHNALSKQGFRRSQNVLYRPACSHCSACLSARIRVDDFIPTRGQRRIVKRNAGLIRKSNAPWATEEQYALFHAYLETRHADGGMSDMDIFEFGAMIEETPIRSRVVEYWADGGDTLRAACLTDIIDDGLSLVYSFFDPAHARDSLGKFMVLDHITLAREAGLPYVYLGYWVPGSPKMDYKAHFSGIELFYKGKWRDPADLPTLAQDVRDPMQVAPITRQVTQIKLPEQR